MRQLQRSRRELSRARIAHPDRARGEPGDLRRARRCGGLRLSRRCAARSRRASLRLAPLRQRLVTVPFELDRPYWVEDPRFDLDFHLRHISVPAAGPRRAARRAGRAPARPAARSHASALGDVRDRGARERALRDLHQGAPRAARRRAGDRAVRRARGRRDGAQPRSAERPRTRRVPGALEMLVRGLRRRRAAPAPRCSRAVCARRSRPRAAEASAGLATASGLLGRSRTRPDSGACPGCTARSASRRASAARRAARCPRARAAHALEPRDQRAPALGRTFTLSLGDVNRVRRAFGVTAERRRARAHRARAARVSRGARNAAPGPDDRDGADRRCARRGEAGAGGHRVVDGAQRSRDRRAGSASRGSCASTARCARRSARTRAFRRAVLEDLGRIGA